MVGVAASISLVQVASAFFTTHGTGSGALKLAALSLDHLTVSPQVANVVVGQSASYTVKAYDNFGGSKDVTASSSLSITHGTCDILTMTCTSDTTGNQTVTASYKDKTATASQVVGPASTSTSIDAKPTSPSLVGQSVTYDAHVSVDAPGAGSPTGNVEFFDGGVAIPGCGDVSGNALTGTSTSCTVTYGTVGSHTITAQYLGDINFLASAISDPITQVVNQSSTSTATTTDLSDYVTGQSIVVTANVSAVAPGSGTPTGTVVVTDGVNPANTCTINLSSTTSCTITENTPGTYTLTGTYGGDANFLGSSGSAAPVTVGSGGPSTLASTTVVTDNASSPTAGSNFTFTATVSAAASGSGTPAGTVTWRVSDPQGHAVSCPTTTLTAGVATCAITNALAGNYSASAQFTATDGVFSNSGSNTDSVTVGSGGPSTLASTTVVTDNASSPTAGSNFTFTATVSAAASGSGTPAGTVTWRVSDPQGHAVSCPTTTLTAGVATCAITNALAGNYSASAQFTATDGVFSNSGSNTDSVTVGSGGPSTLASTTVVTDNASSPTAGSNFTFTATVSAAASGSGTPAGTVTWRVSDPQGHAVSCPTTTLTAGVATCAITNALAGNYSASAQFTATDGVFSNSGSNTDSVTVGSGGPSTILQTSVTSQSVLTTSEASIISAITTNDSVGTVVFTPSSDHGLAVNDSGAITVTGNLAVGTYSVSGSTSDNLGDTGSYSFTLNVTSVPILQTSLTSQTVLTTSEASIVSAITTNDSVGTVVFTPSSDHGLAVNDSGAITVTGNLAVGTYSVSGSTSDNLGDTGTWSFTLFVTSAVEGDSRLHLFPQHPQPLIVGKSATFIARVQVQGGPNNLTGNVYFFVNGAPVTGCQDSSLTVNASSCVINFPNAGTFTVSATYANDPNFADSRDSSLQIVKRGTTSITLSSPAPALSGSQLNYTATIVTTSGSGPLGGSVTFTKDGSPLSGCLNVTLTSNSASCLISFADPGTYSLEATYGGDPNFNGSSALVSQVVISPLAITTTSLATARDGEGYSQTLSATGGKEPYSWSLVAGTLPKGLSLNFSTGAIAGEVAPSGTTQTFTVKVTDSLGATTTKSFTLTVRARIEFTCGDSARTSPGEGFHFYVTTSGPSDRRVSWSGHLPRGVSFDPTTDEFTGTPARGSDGTYVITLTANDPYQSTSKNFTLNVTG